MVMVAGPLHSGCLVTVGAACDAMSPCEIAGCVEVVTGVEAATPLAEVEVTLGGRVGKFRVGPSGLFH